MRAQRFIIGLIRSAYLSDIVAFVYHFLIWYNTIRIFRSRESEIYFLFVLRIRKFFCGECCWVASALNEIIQHPRLLFRILGCYPKRESVDQKKKHSKFSAFGLVPYKENLGSLNPQTKNRLNISMEKNCG